MEKDKFLEIAANAKDTVAAMSHYERCNLVDELDSHWYYEFCEREGTMEELSSYLVELLKTA